MVLRQHIVSLQTFLTMTNLTRKHLATAIAVGIIVASLAACGGVDKQKRIAIVDSIARICREGDIVLREGNSMESHIVATADTHGGYTHCGIIARMGDSMVVVHAVPNEHDFEGDVDRVKAESLRSFFAMHRANGGCLLRCNADTAIAQGSAKKAVEIYRRHTLFDHNFDSSDTTKMYCCELVEYAYQQNGFTIIGTGQHSYNLLKLKLHNVIFPSDFLKSTKIRVVASF